MTGTMQITTGLQTQTTALSTGQASSPDITYLKTGDLGSIQWYKAETNLVIEFRDDLLKMTQQLHQGGAKGLWSSVIVIQDITAEKLVYHLLMHEVNG